MLDLRRYKRKRSQPLNRLEKIRVAKQGGSDSVEDNIGVLYSDQVRSVKYETCLVRSHLHQYAQDDVPMQRQELYKAITRLNKIMEILRGNQQ